MQKRIPIEKARNLGPTTAAEIKSLGFCFLDEIETIGWESFCVRWIERFPERLNLNAFTAVIGALEDCDWRELDSELKDEARQLIREIKSGLG